MLIFLVLYPVISYIMFV